jgi:UDP:flavonoid glycosyltransferase YjiC (YdhE family)
VRVASSPHAFAEVSGLLKQRLGWRRATIHSAWLRSDLNVTFLGRSFYDDSGEPAERTAYVNLFEPEGVTPVAQGSLGIVLGNRGQLARMRLALGRLLEGRHILADEPIDLLAGGRQDNHDLRELVALLASYRVTIHGWVDYAERYSRMHRVISFGGTAAVWQAVNHRVPMLVVDGGVGDQRVNCLAIERLGLGEVLHHTADGNELAAAYERLRDPGAYRAAMDTFCAPANYSDSLESAAARIVRLAEGNGSGG